MTKILSDVSHADRETDHRGVVQNNELYGFAAVDVDILVEDYSFS